MKSVNAEETDLAESEKSAVSILPIEGDDVTNLEETPSAQVSVNVDAASIQASVDGGDATVTAEKPPANAPSDSKNVASKTTVASQKSEAKSKTTLASEKKESQATIVTATGAVEETCPSIRSENIDQESHNIRNGYFYCYPLLKNIDMS